MKVSYVLLLLLVAAVVLDVTARRARRKNKSGREKGRNKGSRRRLHAKRWKSRPSQRDLSVAIAPRSAKSSWGSFLDSLVSQVDDTILVDLSRLPDLISNDYDDPSRVITSTAPTYNTSNAQPMPYSGEWIRLRAAKGFANAGIVEVYRAGRWGLVCDDSWDMNDANVACRQLGFRQGAKAWPGTSHYGIVPNRWHSSDIIMDDVNCDGSEDSLQRCHYNDKHDCTESEAACVVCKPNRGCEEGWVGGGDSCYRFFGGDTNIKTAGARCEAMNASLVSVDSMQENHFLSNILSLTAGKQNHVWYTSGRLTKKGWQWNKKVPRSAKRAKSRGKGKSRRGKGKKGKNRGKGKGNKRRSRVRATRSTRRRMRTVRSAVEVSRWFPGWPGSGVGQEPVSKKGHTCLVLTDLFPLPNGTEINVDYFYWKASRCKQKSGHLTFICEKPAQPQPRECYTGIGEDYRGMMDRTDKGTPCIKWTNTEVNQLSHPGKGLGDHNFCRNPDSDQRPWCWVARGKFGFCPVPRCSTTTPSPPSTTSASVTETPNCPEDEFFCQSENRCIPGQYQCDGEQDCSEAEDEANCEYDSHMFEVYVGRIPEESLSNLTYRNIPLETCAKYCVENMHFICLSFVYNAEERLCHLFNAADNTTVHLLPAEGYSYYLLRSEAVNCTGKFRCDNERCIDAEKKCNGHDDCGDLSDELDCATQPPPMTVRLADGGENSGRVEVHYLGEWGTVCDDGWDIQDAHVVCRMLGYPRAIRTAEMDEFGSGQGNIMLDEVQCVGNETSLQDCPASPWKQHDCQSFESAGVVCQMEKTCEAIQFMCRTASSVTCVTPDKVCDGQPNCPDGSDEADCELKVELKNGTSPREGRVELIRNGLRGTICDDDWSDEDADVVCRMLGYRFGGEAVSGGHQFGLGVGVIWLDNVYCTGEENSLADCTHNGWTNTDCSHLEDAGVRCYASVPTTTTSTTTTTLSYDSAIVHLVNGPTPNQGLVQLEFAGYRGTICDDSFDDKDATVICRMAGFNDGGRAVLNGAYGTGSANMPILLDNLDCTGSESNVLNCRRQSLGSHNCRHSEDVGVLCIVPGDDGDQPETRTTTTRQPPTSILGGAQCGLRPFESLHRSKRQAGGDDDLTAPRVLEPPRYEKIVGGDLAQHGMYPWQVSVQKIFNVYPDGGMLVGHWCGGTIINQFWIVSAAHCFKKLPKSRVLVKVGDHGQKVEDHGEQKFLLEELILHPNYEGRNHDNDIALLKVKSSDGQGIKFNNYVQPACLPTSSTPYTPDTVCLISGWGETGNGNANNLRAAKVPLLAPTTCQYLYKGVLTRNMMCAGYLEGGIDTCQGDSGGPLVCDINGAYTLMGITSWGFGCAQPNSPGVYAITKRYLTWMEDIIRRDAASS